MAVDKSKLVYRKKAAGIVINAQNEILLLQLIQYNDNQWNIPGGGIEDGETPEDAVIRELVEETGTDKFEFIERSKLTYQYDFSDEYIEQILREGRNYRGQEQVQFIYRFTGKDVDIKVQVEEVRRHAWVNVNDLKSYLIFPNQFENIRDVLAKSSLGIII